MQNLCLMGHTIHQLLERDVHNKQYIEKRRKNYTQLYFLVKFVNHLITYSALKSQK